MDYIWDEDREDVLFFGNVYDLEELHSCLDHCLELLNKSQSPREMVLETWLALDFNIRQFLLSGFELSKFCDEDFDLKYMLLPNSFRALLTLFKDTIRYNSKFSLKPEKVSTDETGGLRASYSFWKYIKDKHGKLFDEIIEVQKEYVLYKHPELREYADKGYEVAIFSSDVFDISKPKRPLEKMNLNWRKIASRFDESWFGLAEQINDARNKAAHSIDVEKIGACFGLSGPNIIEAIRSKCLTILNVLLAVKTADK